MITTISLVWYVTKEKYYICIDYILHTVHFIPVTHLFCNGKFVSVNLHHLFLFSLHSPPLWQQPVCPLYLSLCFCFVMFVHLFCFLDYTYNEIIQYFSFFAWLISLSIISSRFIHVVPNGKISLFFKTNFSLSMYTTFSLFIYLIGTWVASISWLL